MPAKFFVVAAATALFVSSTCLAGERPTFNKTRDPRPDILPYWIHDTGPEYRRVYNRPRMWGGWLAYKLAPSSLEAMVWEENLRAGAYNTKHAPPRYKRYFAPKPWEVLQIGARPDFPKQDEQASSKYVPPVQNKTGEESKPQSRLEESSPSDLRPVPLPSNVPQSPEPMPLNL